MHLSRRSLLTAGAALPVLGLAGPAAAARPPSGLSWCGYTWARRSGTGGPGPNSWDGSLPSVDSSGALHLKVATAGTSWACSEVFLTSALGFGTYTWDLTVPALDANVVLGLFTYETDTRETDIEFARWGVATDTTNAQWAVQPASTPGNVVRWTVPPGSRVTVRYRWSSSGTVEFSGSGTSPDGVTAVQIPTTLSSRATTSSRGKVHMNLWLFDGRPPTDGHEVDVAVRSFTFSKG